MRTVLVMWIVGCLWVAPAAADVYTHAEAKVSLEIPAGWEIKTTKKIIIGAAKDKSVGVMFWMVDRKDAEASAKLLDKMLGPIVKDPKWEKPVAAQLGGMKGVMINGTATVRDRPVFVMVAIVAPTPTDKGIMIYAAVEQSKLDQLKDQVRAIFDSVRTIK